VHVSKMVVVGLTTRLVGRPAYLGRPCEARSIRQNRPARRRCTTSCGDRDLSRKRRSNAGQAVRNLIRGLSRASDRHALVEPVDGRRLEEQSLDRLGSLPGVYPVPRVQAPLSRHVTRCERLHLVPQDSACRGSGPDGTVTKSSSPMTLEWRGHSCRPREWAPPQPIGDARPSETLDR
jgi:hypothetical protein